MWFLNMTNFNTRPHRCLPQRGGRSLGIEWLWPERLGWEKHGGSKVCKGNGRFRGGDREYEEVWTSSTNDEERPDVSGCLQGRVLEQRNCQQGEPQRVSNASVGKCRVEEANISLKAMSHNSSLLLPLLPSLCLSYASSLVLCVHCT